MAQLTKKQLTFRGLSASIVVAWTVLFGASTVTAAPGLTTTEGTASGSGVPMFEEQSVLKAGTLGYS